MNEVIRNFIDVYQNKSPSLHWKFDSSPELQAIIDLIGQYRAPFIAVITGSIEETDDRSILSVVTVWTSLVEDGDDFTVSLELTAQGMWQIGSFRLDLSNSNNRILPYVLPCENLNDMIALCELSFHRDS